MTEVNPKPNGIVRGLPRSGDGAPPAARIRRWLGAFADWFLPARCALCAESCDGAVSLCGPCRNDLDFNSPCCPRCAEPLEHPAPMCGRCLKREPMFESAFAACRYAWPLDGLVARFKFSGDLAAGRTLAQLFLQRLRDASITLPDLLVPVPLHDRRLRERGYDQALELARIIARRSGCALAPGLLRRTRATAAQTTLDAKGRRRNVRAAFAVNENVLARLPDRPRIALLDDVMTTGSTLNECAAVLRRAGFERIQVWAIARAPARV